MNVSEAIEELNLLQGLGYGSANLRAYSPLSSEVYPQVKFVLHRDADNEGCYNETFGDWVEVE